MNQLQTIIDTQQKVSHSYHLPNAFHDQLKFKATLKFKSDQTERKISIKSEMIHKNLEKFMHIQDISYDQHAKNQNN